MREDVHLLQDGSEAFPERRIQERIPGGDEPRVATMLVGPGTSERRLGSSWGFGTEAGGQPFGDRATIGWLVIYPEVERFGFRQEHEVPQDSGQIVAMDAVGVHGRAIAGRPEQSAFDGARTAGAVDAASPQHDGLEGAAERDPLALQQAPSGVSLGLRRRVLIHPLATPLRVHSGAGYEDHAPERMAGGKAAESRRRPKTV